MTCLDTGCDKDEIAFILIFCLPAFISMGCIILFAISEFVSARAMRVTYPREDVETGLLVVQVIYSICNHVLLRGSYSQLTGEIYEVKRAEGTLIFFCSIRDRFVADAVKDIIENDTADEIFFNAEIDHKAMLHPKGFELRKPGKYYLREYYKDFKAERARKIKEKEQLAKLETIFKENKKKLIEKASSCIIEAEEVLT